MLKKSNLKYSLKTHLNREVDNEYINRKIDENFKYFDELPTMVTNLSKGEKGILINESIEMCKVDGELHPKEEEFLDILSRHLQLKFKILYAS